MENGKAQMPASKASAAAALGFSAMRVSCSRAYPFGAGGTQIATPGNRGSGRQRISASQSAVYRRPFSAALLGKLAHVVKARRRRVGWVRQRIKARGTKLARPTRIATATAH